MIDKKFGEQSSSHSKIMREWFHVSWVYRSLVLVSMEVRAPAAGYIWQLGTADFPPSGATPQFLLPNESMASTPPYSGPPVATLSSSPMCE
jgi:hypothetical protein